MAEQTEIIKLQLKIDEYSVKAQQAKDQIKELDKAIKELNKDSGARKDLVIEKAQAEKNLKQIQAELKATEKASENSSNVGIKQFRKFAFIMTAVVGAGSELKEFFKKLFKESEAFQAINIKIAEMGKAFSGLIDSALKPVIGNLKTAKDIEFEKSLQKIEEKAIDNIASFEMLARNVEKLGSKLNPTATEQLRYANAVEQLKKEYPEYLSLMSSEIKNHKENISLLEIKRQMLFDDIKRKVIAEELEVAIREQIKAERELKDNDQLRNDSLSKWSELYNKNKSAQEKVIEVEKRYDLEISKTTLAEAQLANVKAMASLKATEAKIAKEQETDAIQEQAKHYDELIKKVEKYDEARKKANEPKLESKELPTDPEALKTQIKSVDEVQNAYKNLKDVIVDTSVTTAEYWDLQLSKAQEFLAKYGDAIKGSLNLGTTYNQIELADVENKYNKEKEALDKNRADGVITEEEYKKKLLALDLKAQKERKKINKDQQKINIGLATMNMAVSVSETLKKYGYTPLGIIMSALATAQGLMNIALIKKQKLKRGGMLEGPSHEQGGIVAGNVEFEGGEGVVNKTAMRNPYLRQIVSNVNQAAGGGVAFSGTSKYRAGGVASFSGASTSRIERLLEALNANVGGLDLSVAVNNSSNSNIDRITSEVTKRQNRFVNKGGVLADI